MAHFLVDVYISDQLQSLIFLSFMIVAGFEKLRVRFLDRHPTSDQAVQKLSVLLYLRFQFRTFPRFPVIAVINMDESFPFIVFKYMCFYRCPADPVERNALVPLVLKGPPLPEDDLVYQFPASFYIAKTLPAK